MSPGGYPAAAIATTNKHKFVHEAVILPTGASSRWAKQPAKGMMRRAQCNLMKQYRPS